jgi:predicted Zn-dependent protease
VGGLVLLGLGLAGWRAAAEVGRWRDFRAAQASLGAGDIAGARERLGRCLKAWPDDAEVHFLAARAARRDGDLASASRELDAAARLQWVPEAIDLERALLAAQRGDLHSVETPLQSWLAHGHPDRELILEILTPIYYKDFRLAEAGECARLWTEARPDSSRAWGLLGEIEERLHHKDAALDAFRHAVAGNPADASARVGLGRLLLDTHQPREAAEHFTEALRLKPTAAARLGLARCRIEQRQFGEANELLDGLLAADPSDAAVLRQRGRLELERDQPARAEPWLRKADARDPFDPDLLFDLSRCLAAQDKKEEADKVVERMKRCEADLARANELTQQFLRKPRDVGLRLQLAEILAHNGKPREAARWLEAALRDEPADAATRRKLADYYEAAGDRRLAELHRRLAAAPPAPPTGP